MKKVSINSKKIAELKVPVLFLVFNRPNFTSKVFKKIQSVKPYRLYISSDGPRKHEKSDLKLIKDVRNYIIKNINWNCEIKILFHKKNLGCKLAVSKAISWFFKNEEQGIILEDDCLPNKAFFKYCEFALKKFKNNNNIYSISGTNLLSDKFDKPVFSLHGSIWGWATWRRAWKKYNVHNTSLTLTDRIHYATSVSELIHIFKIHKFSKNKFYDSWDYQWLFTRISERGLTLIPKVNYIKNIGFDQGTHHKKNEDKFFYPKTINSFNRNDYILLEFKRSKRYDSLLFEYKKKDVNLKERLKKIYKKIVK